MSDKTRADFEAECRRYWSPERCPELELQDGKYESGRTQIAWSFYQAAIAAERERCALFIENYPQWVGQTAKKEIAAAIRQGGDA